MIQQLQDLQQLVFTQAKQLKITPHSIQDVLKHICQKISEIVKCERISIWLFNEDWSTLTAQHSFSIHGRVDPPGTQLKAIHFPTYFQIIQQERVVAINDVQTHPAFHEMEERYFNRKQDVQSLIDANIILSRGIGGVLCCEAEHKRIWSDVDKFFVATIADMLSFIFDRLYRIEIEEHTFRLAYKDPLTGMNNEHAFIEKVSSMLHSFELNERGAFIYFRLDQFSEIQSALGHDTAEQVIQETAKRLEVFFPDPVVTCRVAFDHFLVFSTCSEIITNTSKIMRFFEQELSKPIIVNGQEIYMTFSYGLSFYPENVTGVKCGIQTAQMALETARKQTPRKARGVYTTEIHAHMKQSILYEMNLQKGLDFKEFTLFYQPQVDCLTGEICGFEALIRWYHPEKGLIMPLDFIELAESTGFIRPIGEWVIKEACAQLKNWKQQGLEYLTIAVNLSPRHFLHPNFPFFLQYCVEEAGIKPSSLVLEITENVALEDHSAVQKRIALLTEMGYSIAIDDFGTGYSAFIYLQHFPIQQIKIDRQFIMDIEHNPKSASIVRAIIRIGQELNLQTVAEGIETLSQWNMLKDIGCSHLQGYYFCRPLPITEVTKLLQNKLQKVKLPVSSL